MGISMREALLAPVALVIGDSGDLSGIGTDLIDGGAIEALGESLGEGFELSGLLLLLFA